MNNTPLCRCKECQHIHEEFIEKFGHWPSMTHAQSQELKAKRLDNIRSWDRMMEGRPR